VSDSNLPLTAYEAYGSLSKFRTLHSSIGLGFERAGFNSCTVAAIVIGSSNSCISSWFDDLIHDAPLTVPPA